VFAPAELVALRLADAISDDPSTLADGLVAALREHFDETQLAEIILVCGQANLNNRAGNAAKQLLGPA
jgi:alkylhydroperoxidase family enzyme